jgi:hypothetical protein
MSDKFDHDQEAIADIVYRDKSERERGRSKPEHLAEMRIRLVPALVGGSPAAAEWRCRYPGPKSNAAPCRVTIPVDESTVEYLAQWNAQLVSRGEHPIETHEVMVCDAHKRLIADHARTEMPRIRERRQTEMRDAIQKLKASDRPREERELIEIVTKLHHPDVDGLIATLEEKLGSSRKRRAL